MSDDKDYLPAFKGKVHDQGGDSYGVTIPKQGRDQLGIEKGDLLLLEIEGTPSVFSMVKEGTIYLPKRFMTFTGIEDGDTVEILILEIKNSNGEEK